MDSEVREKNRSKDIEGVLAITTCPFLNEWHAITDFVNLSYSF